jgi:hypothetical protein
VAPELRVKGPAQHAEVEVRERADLRAFLTASFALVRQRQLTGELPAGVSPGTITDIVFGVIWYRTLATREPLDERLVDELVSLLAGN